MYPFERFTESAKNVLVLSKEEAERGQHPYIGTEHIGLALMLASDGLASECMTNLGVSPEMMRPVYVTDAVPVDDLGTTDRLPTRRVKRVIELAFESATRSGDSYVGTEHLLLAIIEEGKGFAAHVLGDLEVTADTVSAELARIKIEHRQQGRDLDGQPNPWSAAPPSGDPTI